MKTSMANPLILCSNLYIPPRGVLVEEVNSKTKLISILSFVSYFAYCDLQLSDGESLFLDNCDESMMCSSLQVWSHVDVRYDC